MLTYEIITQIKDPSKSKKEDYSQEEIEFIRTLLESHLSEIDSLPDFDIMTEVRFVGPLRRDLSDIRINLATLRSAIADHMAHGVTTMDITHLLKVIRQVYHDDYSET